MRLPQFRPLAIGIVAVLGLAAILQTQTVMESSDAVTRSMRFDVSWIGAHGRLEAAQFETYLARYAALRRAEDAQNAQLFYQILLGRLDSWDVGGFKEFLDSSPSSREALDQVKNLLLSLETEFSDLSQVNSLPDLLEAIAPVGPAIDQIGGDATISAVSKAADIRDTLNNKRVIQTYLVIASIVTACLLLILSGLQNRSLQSAHIELESSSRRFKYLATHDTLTGLPNRNAFTEALGAADLIRDKYALLAIDLDGFKAINDTWGHVFGDKLLIQVADRLKGAIVTRSENMIARFGGDEFMALCCLDDWHSVEVLAEQILHSLERPFSINGSVVTIGATAGIALADFVGATTDGLMADADMAQNDTKWRHKGTAGLYNRTLRQNVERRLKLENDLREAIERRVIEPHYQVQVDLQTGVIVGVEALARWKHPQLGWIAPTEFIPIAEESGLIVNLGRVMLDQACADAVLLPDTVRVAVNLSVIQIMHGSLVETVSDALLKSGLSAARLKLEVTESVLMNNPKRAISVLSGLKRLGTDISLDDFGTGYSSLSYLNAFTWDEVKIDRSFLRDLEISPLGLSVIEAVLVLAEKLNASVTVEGIETEEQRLLLSKTGCSSGQGYLFGKPVPIETVCRLIEANASQRSYPLRVDA